MSSTPRLRRSPGTGARCSAGSCPVWGTRRSTGTDRIRHRHRVAGHVHGPELAGPAWHNGERRDAGRAELQALLRHRPEDRRPALHRAELSLGSAKRDLNAARYRLQRAEQRLEELGPLSQLRRGARQETASTLDAIDRFSADITRAEANIARHQRRMNELRPALDDRPTWDAHHNWPHERLRNVEDHLAAPTPEGVTSTEATGPGLFEDPHWPGTTPGWAD